MLKPLKIAASLEAPSAKLCRALVVGVVGSNIIFLFNPAHFRFPVGVPAEACGPNKRD